MAPTLKAAEYISPYKLRLTFSDGKVGDIDLANELWGEIFEPLKDVEFFRSFKVDLNSLSCTGDKCHAAIRRVDTLVPGNGWALRRKPCTASINVSMCLWR